MLRAERHEVLPSVVAVAAIAVRTIRAGRWLAGDGKA
jgi:hypothetical protein